MKRAVLSALCGLVMFALSSIASAACVLQSISIGQTVSGTLSSTDCVDSEAGGQYYGDYYQFAGTAGQQVYISQSSSAVDAFIRLIYPDNTYIANDDGGGGTNARLPSGSGYLTLSQTGNYMVEASSAVALQTGAYSLSLLGNSAPNPGTEDPVLKQDVTAIVNEILGFVGGDSGTGVTQQLQLVLEQVLSSGSGSTCPVVTITPPLNNLDQVPPNLNIAVNYGSGCVAKDGKTMAGSASISFTNLQVSSNDAASTVTMSASSFSMVFNNITVNGAPFANGSASGSFSLQIGSDGAGAITILGGQATLQLTNFLLPNGNAISGTVTFNAPSATSMTMAINLTTPNGPLVLNLTITKQANGSYVVNTSAPGQGKGYTIEIKSLVLNSTTCTKNYPIGGSITFAKSGQTATAGFDASCSGNFAYSATGGAAVANYSDSWWNANESGWGITITDHGTNLFVQWYAYDQTGHNQKYVISGGTFTNGKCLFTGTIVHVSGPSWTAPSFNPNLVVRRTAGSATIDFCATGVAAGTIVFNYTADGVTGSKQLTRLSFGNDVPHQGGTANTGGPDFTDLWWNSSESGWGVSITQHGNNVFFRIFVYDTDGRPLLFIVPGVTFSSPTSFTGSLVLTTGPYFGTTPFNPNLVVRTTAGSATLTFSDANHGVLSYTVNGVTKTKSIERLAF